MKGIAYLSELITGNTGNMRSSRLLPVPVIANDTDDFFCIIFFLVILPFNEIIAIRAMIKTAPEIQLHGNALLAFDIKIIIIIFNIDYIFPVKNSHIAVVQANQIRISLWINSTVIPGCGQKGVICFHISRREKQDAEQQDHKDKNIFFSLHNSPHCQKGMRHQAHPLLKIIYASVLAAASTTWPTSTEVVTLPTPPGTGVMASTIGSTSSKATSPQSLPSAFTLIPTSMIV